MSILAITNLCAEQLVLVEDGVSRAPIVIFENAPPMTRKAADELAEYIERTSGARPEVIAGKPDPLPAQAIWVGYQPVLDGLFPELDFDFQHPEEILIAANANHVVITGRDRWIPEHAAATGKQQEYGTANAVYTFLQDYLDVRWLWPGEYGIDVIKRVTIALAPFEYRYHPQIRGRAGMLYLSSGGKSYATGPDWVRHQRMLLGSLDFGGGHGFKDWWERFHKTHPEIFALQPDGSRGGGDKPYPGADTVKMCESNPVLWDLWLEDVAAQLESNPGRTVFSSAPNDSWASGWCVCENCRAWDHPDGEVRGFSWRGLSQEYVALSDRQVTFANVLARKLRERYPDKDYYVLMMPYGHSRPAPIAAVPDDNVFVLSVANFMFDRRELADRGSSRETTHRDQFDAWGDVASNLGWRPNTGSPHGMRNGGPLLYLKETMEDFRFIADNNCIGIFIDTLMEHWSTQGPLFYLMAQLAWNPYADGQAIMLDYYRRGFGPAAGIIEEYWDFLGENMGAQGEDAFYEKAYALLDRVDAAVAEAPELYRKRVEFLRVGIDFLYYTRQARQAMTRFKESNGQDTAAEDEARRLWIEKIHPLATHAEYPSAINWGPLRPRTGRLAGTFPDDLKRRW
ncbi:MAG: DUF4838 domain-containing protein [Lentisphaerae bacterium]|nr:DUF4838 domain-containing protein [Lentisphaerota bacterium]